MRVLARPAFSNRGSNPYNWLLYTNMAKLGVEVHEHSRCRLLTGYYDVWHLHWPESPLNRSSSLMAASRLAGLLGMMDVARRRGTKVVWTVHNLQAHEEQHPGLAKWFWTAFVARLDGYISLSEAGHELARSRFPELARLPGSVVPLGHFRECYPDRVSREEARTRLGMAADATVFAFVGQLRRYKGVTALCGAFSTLAGEHLRLLVTGEAKEAQLVRELEASAARDRRIALHVGFVPERDLQLYLRAADLVVLPFVNIFNSASALLALSFDRPILVPATGPLRELRDRAGAEWVLTYEGELTGEVLADAVDTVHERSVGQPRLESLDWPVVAAQTRDALWQICGNSPPSTAASGTPTPGRAQPTVSVVLPVYNRAAKVRRAIDSVLAQTFQDFELIVVDDASTDDSGTVVRSIGDPRIRYIRHAANRGGSAARNSGIGASSGEFVAFLDSDDEWLPPKLERQLAVFHRSGGDLGLVYTGAFVLSGEKERKRKPRCRGRIAEQLLEANVVGGASVGMIPRSVLDEVGSFDEILPARQDADLWLRIADRFGVDYVDECLVKIDQCENHGRITNGENRVRARELFLGKHRDRFTDPRLLHRFIRDTARACHRLTGDVERARDLYRESIRIHPASAPAYLYWLCTFVPEPMYKRMAELWRRVMWFA